MPIYDLDLLFEQSRFALHRTIIGFFTLFLRTLKVQFETMHVELSGFRHEMDARFDAVNARLDATDRRIEGIDRDIQLVFSKVFGRGGSVS